MFFKKQNQENKFFGDIWAQIEADYWLLAPHPTIMHCRLRFAWIQIKGLHYRWEAMVVYQIEENVQAQLLSIVCWPMKDRFTAPPVWVTRNTVQGVELSVGPCWSGRRCWTQSFVMKTIISQICKGISTRLTLRPSDSNLRKKMPTIIPILFSVVTLILCKFLEAWCRGPH